MSDPFPSVFAIVDLTTDPRWVNVVRETEGHLESRGINRLLPLVKDRALTGLIERHYIDKDYRDTFSSYYSKRFNTPASRLDIQRLPQTGEFHYSSAFNRGFIVNDDNLSPYLGILEKGYKPPSLPVHPNYSLNDVDSFIAPLPDKVFMPAEGFQAVAERTLKQFLPRCSGLAGKQLLLRAFLTTCRSFKRVLLERSFGNELVKEIYLEMPLPHFIWVCEISEPGLYASEGKVLGELLWDATRNPHEAEGLICLHFPQQLFFDSKGPFNAEPHLQQLDLNEDKPYSLYRSNLRTI